jgi:uroporphyrinogen-III synthase
MRVVVTRPVREAARWVEQLQARGHAAVALPLLDIVPAPDAGAVQAAHDRLAAYRAVMFVSANAVHGFFAAGALEPAAGWPRAWAPGPGTRAALCDAGWPPDAIDAPADDASQFDSENLWAEVAGQLRAGERLLLVRGANTGGRTPGRDWMAQRLAAVGIAVDTVAAYARQAPSWSPQQLEFARSAAADGSIWLFSSSEAAGQLQILLPAQDWNAARAIATHPRIVQAVRALGFGSVLASRPALPDVVASIESIR